MFYLTTRTRPRSRSYAPVILAHIFIIRMKEVILLPLYDDTLGFISFLNVALNNACIDALNTTEEVRINLFDYSILYTTRTSNTRVFKHTQV
jgi:hypothetical protein